MPNFMLYLFNRGAASPDNKPGEVFANLPLLAGACVADIVSGGGYYTEEEVILDKMERVGYDHVQELRFLPRQSFNLFAARP